MSGFQHGDVFLSITGGNGVFQRNSEKFTQPVNCKPFGNTYRNNFQVTPAMVHRSIWALRFGCRPLSDKSGKKKLGIAVVESIFTKHPVASSKLVTDTISDYRWSCNLDHQVWCNPWKPAFASTASFVDLFHQTLLKCSNVYYLLNNAITSPVSLDKQDLSALLHELGNYSYHSGLPV